MSRCCDLIQYVSIIPPGAEGRVINTACAARVCPMVSVDASVLRGRCLQAFLPGLLLPARGAARSLRAAELQVHSKPRARAAVARRRAQAPLASVAVEGGDGSHGGSPSCGFLADADEGHNHAGGADDGNDARKAFITSNQNTAADATPDEENDEFFLVGLSYPTDALDWCVTHAHDVTSSTTTTTTTSSSTSSSLSSSLSSSSLSSPAAFAAGEHISVNNTRVAGVTDFHAPTQTRQIDSAFVDTFRMSSPYINAHQGLIFVIHIPGDLLFEEQFANVMEDIALMRVLGIKPVLILGPQSLVTQRLAREGVVTRSVDGIRVTDARTLQVVKELAGSMRFEVECALARGVTNMPSASRTSVVGGNFFSARPVGVVGGEDFGYTGKVRRIDAHSIRKRLEQGDIVMLSNVGASPSGQLFNCKAEEVAAECAAQLNADKIIFLGRGDTLYDRRSGQTVANLPLRSAARFLQARTRAEALPDELRLALWCCVDALERGVRRAHILNRYMNGALLAEVFHRDGAGLMVSRDQYEEVRPAHLKDVSGIDALLRTVAEDEGRGVDTDRHRSLAALERDIDAFVIVERDGMIIACLSLVVLVGSPTWAQLSAIAIHPDYARLGKQDALLAATEALARRRGVRNLFLLPARTPQPRDWLRAHGFEDISLDELPRSAQRHSPGSSYAPSIAFRKRLASLRHEE